MTLIRRLILALALSAGLAPAVAQVPAPVPALPDTERRTSYSITASTCACAVNFALYGDSTDYQNWVEVFINGVRYNYNDASHGWTITTPSGSLSTLARPITNAVLTFNAVQTGTVQIVGARRPRRTSQFNESAPIPVRNLNQMFTDIISQNREMWDKTNDVTGRALLSQPGVSLGLLPLPSSCPSAFLSFDAAGTTPICRSSSGTGNVTLPVVANHIVCFDGVAGFLKDCGAAPPFPAISFPSVSGGTTTLTTNIHSGSPIIDMPTPSGELVAWITPQYIGAYCDGVTNDSTALQAAVNNLPASGGIIYFPKGSVCLFSSGVDLTGKKQVTFLGDTNKGDDFGTPSQIIYTGTGSGTFIEAGTGPFLNGASLRIEGLQIKYSSSSFTGTLIRPRGGYWQIKNSSLGPSTARTGTATLIDLSGSVDGLIDNVLLSAGKPAIQGGTVSGQNVRLTVLNSKFQLGEGPSIKDCGEAWTLQGNSFESDSTGKGNTFTNPAGFKCYGMSWIGNWFGDVTLAGGTWITGAFEGFTFTGNRMDGDVGSATQGISLSPSDGIAISGNRFEFLNTAINCTTATTTGVRVTGNYFTNVTNKISNPSNCANIQTEGNSPSISLVAVGQIEVGQSGADPAPKTVSGDATLASTGALTFATVNSNTGSFGDGTHVGQFTVNGKGQVTAASSFVITGAAPTGAAGGDLGGTYPNPTINNAPVIAKLLTAFASGAGTVSAADSILSALQKIDGNVALKAPLASPALTGTPTAPTASPGTNTTQLATTAYADAIAALKANLASPTFTGVPAAPTAAVDTNTTQIATTAMVLAQAASATPLIDGAAAVGTSTRYARGDHVHPTDTTRAALASPTFTGTPAAPTAAVDTNTTQLATTAMVLAQAASATPLIDGTAAVGTSTRYARGDHVHPTDTTRAPTASPTFTGTATAATLAATTINAFTLGGTISGGGNQINNVIVGTSTPLAGFFTALSATTSVTSPLLIGGTGTTGTQLTFKTTTGVGTTDAFAFVGGSNGATTFATLNATGIGLGAAPSQLFTGSFSSTTNNGTTLQNTNSGGVVSWQTQNDTSDTAEFGMRGSARASFGSLVASDAYFYTGSSTALTFMVNSATGKVKWATGGSAQTMQLSAAGGLTVSSVATDAGAGNLLLNGILKYAAAPTTASGAGPFAIGSGSTLNVRIKVNMSGTDYWVPASATAW